jgi:hypothetical protein
MSRSRSDVMHDNKNKAKAKAKAKAYMEYDVFIFILFTYLFTKGSCGYALQIAHGLRFADPVA